MGERTQMNSLTTIESSNLLIVANEGYDLSQFSEVLDDGKRYGILLIESLSPANTPIVSYVWVKR
jgi:hypothetical protein